MIFNVADYGALGGNGVNDTNGIKNCIAAAGAATVYFPKPSSEYIINETLTMPNGQSWIGEGGARSTTLRKTFDGDFIVVNDLCAIWNLNFECSGKNGRGIYVAT